MKNQNLQCAVEFKNGVVNRIGKSSVIHPMPKFNNGSIKWYEDKKKTTNK